MRILFLTHYFPPEVNAPAVRTFEHCREWVAGGHEVHVVTCIPSHPVGKPFPGYRSRRSQYEDVEGIHTHRVWTYLAANRGLLRRTLNYLSFMPAAISRSLRLGRFDVVVGTSPQFFCAVAAWAVARLRGVPWIFEVRDLWPESIAAVGAIPRSAAALRLLERFELYLYRDAAAVACVTRSFVSNLTARGVDPAKLHYIPNGILPEFWASGDRTRGRQDLGVSDGDFLVSYVGTVGLAHGIRTVIDAAARLRDQARHVRFLIAGDGAELEGIRQLVAERSLEKVTVRGLVPRDRIPSLLAASDVILVTLKLAEVFKTVLPSKMFEAMAARRAIVLSVDGEARETLQRSGGGIAVDPGDPDALAEAIIRLADDPALCAEMGAAGGEFVEREFDRRSWAARYVTVLDSVCAPRQAAFGPSRRPTATSRVRL